MSQSQDNEALVEENPPPELRERDRKTYRPKLPALAFLRFIAAMHIVCFHFFRDEQEPYYKRWNSFATWGGSQLTFFFLLSGFTLSYQYYGREDTLHIRHASFWFKRFARLYPLYMASVVAEIFLLDPSQIEGKQLAVMAASLQTWVSWAFENPINTPSWTVGSFLLLYAVFPTALRMLRGSGGAMALLWYLLTGIQALNAMGYRLTIYASFNNIFLAAHAPSFMFGVVLGCAFAHDPDALRRRLGARFGAAIEFVGVPVLLAGMFVAFIFVEIASSNTFLFVWISNGMLLPVYALLVWCAARARDPLSKYILPLEPFVELGNASYALYITQTAVYGYTSKYLCGVVGPTPCALVFVVTLVLTSVVLHNIVERPLGEMVMSVFTRVTQGRRLFPRQPPHGYAPPPGSSRGGCGPSATLATTGYYVLFFGVVGAYLAISITRVPGFEWDQIVSQRGHPTVEVALNAIKWAAAAALPALIFTSIGHLVWPPTLKKRYEPIDILSRRCLDQCCRVRFRYVTRGKYPLLVSENVEEAVRVLRSCPGLPPDAWKVEVVTDCRMGIEDRCLDSNVVEIVVPADYHVYDSRGQETKFKARALHYAITASGADDIDWIVHLDEETRFDHRTVASVLHHVTEENDLVVTGKQRYGRIGQGVILYGTGRVGPIRNWVTTLADCVRVADDFGKFRLQYQLHEPLIGMHGSFVVASHAVERAIGFNAGTPGNITEDAHFALMARGRYGVRFKWVDSYCYEQSPFNLKDFVMQRRRWFGGLWLVCRDSRIPLAQRLCLLGMLFTWAFSFFVGLAMFLCMIIDTEVGTTFKIMLAFVASLSCWGYVLGFVLTFRIQDGISRYVCLLYLLLLLQPVFAILEITGVVCAVVYPVTGFFVVQKERVAAATSGFRPGDSTAGSPTTVLLSAIEEGTSSSSARSYRSFDPTDEIKIVRD